MPARKAPPAAAAAKLSGPVERKAAQPPHPVRHRALLIGINDYSASQLPPAPAGRPANQRLVPSLKGAVNDVHEMRKMLVARYGFARGDILLLTDQAATRDAVLHAIQQQLVEPSGAGDIVFFYWSGHGSQVVNSLSNEPDKMDETIVPADAVRGVPDLRDKELRALFSRVLANRANLTVLLDSCHSGSGLRGLFDGARFRGVEPDRRDVKDGALYGPRPEDNGALVLAATQDFDLAWESQDERGRPHGAFSLALLRAMRDAVSGEPAEETFQRARARLQAERRFQEPALSGDAHLRRAPLLGQPAGPEDGRVVVAVESVESDGTVLLQGGLAGGLTEGSELRLLAPGRDVRIVVTEVDGFSRCKGRVSGPIPEALRSGALAEVVKWAAPPGPPLRVWMATAGDVSPAARLAQELGRQAPRKGVHWVEDPTRQTPTHILRWREQGWELLTWGGGAERLGREPDAASVLARLQREPKGPRALFVQLPVPEALARAIPLGPGSAHSGIETAEGPEQADYVLAGRLAEQGIDYAWLRPGMAETDQPRSSLPVRTAWQSLSPQKAAGALEEALLILRKVQGWLNLETPAGAASPYELVIHQGPTGGELVGDRTLMGQRLYNLALRLKEGLSPSRVYPRYCYIFAIDSSGRSSLLFPDPRTSDQNRFPVSPGAPPEISLGSDGTFRVDPPYGADTYFLLTSGEPIPNPWILDWEGARARGPLGTTPLEELLSLTGGWIRGATRVAPPALWSVERKLFFSTSPPQPGKGGK